MGMTGKVAAIRRLKRLFPDCDAWYCSYRHRLCVRRIYATHVLPKKGLVASVRVLRRQFRWIRTRDVVVDLLKFGGVPIERRCAVANKIMRRSYDLVMGPPQ